MNRAPIIAHMQHIPSKPRATLELDTNDEGRAPTGALLTPDGRRRAFTGWIELASSIEDWRQAEANVDQSTDRSMRT